MDACLHQVREWDLHPEFTSLEAACRAERVPSRFPHWLLVGPAGVGKYTAGLRLIAASRMDDTLAAAEDIPFGNPKKLVLENATCLVTARHYEIDLALLGCKAKDTWNAWFGQIVQSLQCTRVHKLTYLLCRNAHTLHPDVMILFSIYLEQAMCLMWSQYRIHLRFVLLTEQWSCLPPALVRLCVPVFVRRPSADRLHAWVQRATGAPAAAVQSIQPWQISNLKEWIGLFEVGVPAKRLAHFTDLTDRVARTIATALRELQAAPPAAFGMRVATLREALYDILVYNLDVGECVWTLLRDWGDPVAVRAAVLQLPRFWREYNNNYRPIFHLELLSLRLLHNTDVSLPSV
eukprot:gene11424-12771_t